MSKALPRPAKRTRQKLVNGVILHEGSDFVAIATGITNPSSNEKTGGMVQVWIIHRHLHPNQASALGADEVICGNCPHRHSLGGGCYVVLHQAPANVYRAYHAGSYAPPSMLPIYIQAIKRRRLKIRFGAYGDPSLIPPKLINDLIDASAGHTGYTHQWRNNLHLAGLFHASVDNLTEKLEAELLGFKTFRVADHDAKPLRDEAICPATLVDYIQCIDCGMCDGSTKSAMVHAHGQRVNRVLQTVAA